LYGYEYDLDGVNDMENEEKPRCPRCGKEYTEEMVVGKTKTFKKGERSTYNVVVCSCGEIYRGEQIMRPA
jgi:predicted nucleic-acid-binding Zn-ribbon protein